MLSVEGMLIIIQVLDTITCEHAQSLQIKHAQFWNVDHKMSRTWKNTTPPSFLPKLVVYKLLSMMLAQQPVKINIRITIFVTPWF